MKATWLLIVAALAMRGEVEAVDVKLTVREVSGVARVGNPVNSGIPLPMGMVRDPGELRLLDARGHIVPASIEARSRWLKDDSLKWVTVHFLASVPARGTLTYRLTDASKLPAASTLVVEEGDNTVTIVTGPAKFVVPTDRLAPLKQVYLRTSPEVEFREKDSVLSGPSTITLAGRNGESKVVPRVDTREEYKSELASIGEPFSQTAEIRSVQVEERGPGRAVVALKGTFSTSAAKSLDFTARLYFYAGSALSQMTFSIVNTQMDSMSRFVGIERLSVVFPLKTSGPARVALSIDGNSRKTTLGSMPVSLLQSSFSNLRVAGVEGQPADGESSDGWVQLASGAGALTAGTRWFRQVYPMGVRVRDGSVVELELKPQDADRIDLYTAGAKTHFLFFQFDARGEIPPESIAAGTVHPLVASCSPDWYCQETRVMGDLFSADAELYEPAYRELVARYQKRIDSCLNRIVANRPRPGWKVNEYGWLNFGSGLHHSNYVRENAQESWWDSNYYDFPHAALLNYMRTGDLVNLTTAEEAGLHLADLDICHSFPGHPERAGSPRSAPVVGHFRNYTRGQPYQGHDSFTFYKNESLYELYYLTGERWYREVGLMSSEFAMAFWGRGALRNLAHGIWGVLSAYQDTHQARYLDRSRFFVDEWGKSWQDKSGGGFDDQEWMYGLAFEAYDKYYRVTGDQQTADYLVKALDALIREFWKPEGGTGGLDGINLFGFGLGYEYTGNPDYLKKGLQLLERLSTPGSEGDRVKTFAQNFRASPYFLKYLTKGYRPKLAQR